MVNEEVEIGESRGGSTRSPARSQTSASCNASPTVKAADWIFCSPSGVMMVIGNARRICKVIGKVVSGELLIV